jgi:hypothetical protein
MKKIMVLVAAVLFLAAACNSNTASNTGSTPVTASTKVDAAVNALNASVDNEEKINLQSDDDVINSDNAVINGYYGVSNANF